MSGSQQLLLGGSQAQAVDPYFYAVTSLLHGDGTNGAQNNTFLDSSTNNFTITRNGNTTQGSFSPFSQTGWGNYFGGAGNYLSNASAALIGATTTTFTAEAWIYMTAAPTTDVNNIGSVVTLDGQAAGGINYNAFGPISSQKLVLRWFDSASKSCTGSTTIPLNTWTHIAVVVNANAISMYVNGVAETLTGTTTLTNRGGTSSAFAIAAHNYSSFSGYISNLRVTTTAVYSSAFTPSTTPLTAITGTVLLTCQSNRFVDNSANAYALTVGGSPSVQPFSPFNPTTAYSTSTVGGSGYFDGSGDYLVTPSNANLSSTLLGSDFTIECWLYLTSYPSGGAPIWTNSVSNSDGFSSAYVTSSGTIGTGKVGVNEFATTATVVLNAWNHFATVRSGATVYTYLNGVQVASGAASTYLNTSATKPIQIAQSNQTSPANLTGYISGYRITTAAQYTGSTYTIPTAPPTAISGTNLLLNFTNAGIYDATSKNDLETVGNAQISTTQSKFNGSSMYFDGTGDYLYRPATPILPFRTGDFTLECWIYTASPSDSPIMESRSVSDATDGFTLTAFSTTVIRIYTSSALISATVPNYSSAWTHVAVVKYNGTTTLYVNGISGGTTTSLGDMTNQDIVIGGGRYAPGSSPTINKSFNGYIDDFRITRGIARYTSNFTPPTTAFLTL